MNNRIVRIERLFSLILFALVLFQSCKVYDSGDITLKQAVESDTKFIKILTQNNKRYIFDSLYFQDEKLYGHLVSSKKHPDVKLLIQDSSVKEIHLYNKKKSRARTIILVACIGGVYLFNYILLNQNE